MLSEFKRLWQNSRVKLDVLLTALKERTILDDTILGGCDRFPKNGNWIHIMILI